MCEKTSSHWTSPWGIKNIQLKWAEPVFYYLTSHYFTKKTLPFPGKQSVLTHPHFSLLQKKLPKHQVPELQQLGVYPSSSLGQVTSQPPLLWKPHHHSGHRTRSLPFFAPGGCPFCHCHNWYVLRLAALALPSCTTSKHIADRKPLPHPPLRAAILFQPPFWGSSLREPLSYHWGYHFISCPMWSWNIYWLTGCFLDQ